jgi:hypothetical protein
MILKFQNIMELTHDNINVHILYINFGIDICKNTKLWTLKDKKEKKYFSRLSPLYKLQIEIYIDKK